MRQSLSTQTLPSSHTLDSSNAAANSTHKLLAGIVLHPSLVWVSLHFRLALLHSLAEEEADLAISYQAGEDGHHDVQD